MNMLMLACAVCGAGNDPAKGSYVVMSMIISLLPLAMFGGLITYLVKQSRKAAAAELETPSIPAPVER